MDERLPEQGDAAVRWTVRRLPPVTQWVLLAAGSLIIIALLELVHLPAALLLGPMMMAIAMGAGEARIAVPKPAFMLAQVVIGCLMARSLPASIFTELVEKWPIYGLGIGSVVAVAAGLGILLTRLRVLPGTTAIWGSAPGASTAMIVMAEAFGADSRLVAFMLYLRIVVVAVAAAVISRLFIGTPDVVVETPWFPPVAALPFVGTCALMIGALIVARVTRIAAGNILLPIVGGVVLQDVFGLQIELPPALLAVAYVAIGWTIGLRFTRPILAHARRALPAVLGSLLVLLLACGFFALLLVLFAGVDPLTAYLATSPGGADSVAIIAANAKVDAPFVMAMQAGRLLVVMLTGPLLAKFIAERSGVKDA